MPSTDGPTDPIVLAHRSRHGRQELPGTRPDVTLAGRDLMTFLAPDFFPPDEALGDLDFRGLDDLRAEHQRHAEQCGKAETKARELEAKFRAEDKARQIAIRKAFSEGTSPSKARTHVTPDDERKQQLADAHERVRLAYEVAREWGTEALGEARARVVNWETSILERQGAVNQQIEEQEARLRELKADLLTDERMKAWLGKLSKAHPGTLMTFAALNGIVPFDPDASFDKLRDHIRPGMTIGA